MSFRVGCIQNNATEDVEANLVAAQALIEAARAEGADLICLPENFACLEPQDVDYVRRGFSEDTHPALARCRELAARLGVWLLLGSLSIRISEAAVNNRSYLLSGSGDIVATYDKVHLFDVVLSEQESYRESAVVAPGMRASLARTPWGILGMSVCYDVRFPALYRALAQAGAVFITIPAVFTRPTGEAHWHVLVRARAIENGCFVFAPGQCGVRPWGRATYGHSLIVDPWGRILADAGPEPGFVTADIDPDQVAEARRRIPSLRHDRRFDPPAY